MNKGFCGVLLIAALFVSAGAAEEKAEVKKTVKFKFEENVQKVKLVGSFGKDGKIVTVSMVKLFGGFYVNLNLAPDFYLYRYLVGKDKYVADAYGEFFREDGVKYSLLRVWPEAPGSFLHLASGFIAKNREEWAIDTYIEGIRRYPGEANLYFALGGFYEEKKWFGFAADCYHSYLEKEPGNVEMRYRIANCYEKFYQDTGKNKYRKSALFHWKRLLGTKYDEEAIKRIW
ncbi:MAG: hypothetical protein ABIJ15_06360 [bacterium]